MSPTATTQRGAKAPTAAEGGDAAQAPAKSKKKLIMIGAGVVLVAVAAWYFLLRSPAPADAAAPPPTPGIVTPLDPISINLTDGHYLRLGIALQATIDAEKAPDGSKALDLAISTFTGQTVAALADPKKRDEMKHELEAKISEAYEKEVMGIYFTGFVTQ